MQIVRTMVIVLSFATFAFGQDAAETPAAPALDQESAPTTQESGATTQPSESATTPAVDALSTYGVVSGLAGTGDGPDSVPLRKVLVAQNRRIPFAQYVNFAWVNVVVDVPPEAQPGDRVDAKVVAIGDATSLRGGTLEPIRYNADDRWVIIEGPIELDEGSETTGRVVDGATLSDGEPVPLPGGDGERR